MTVIDCPQCGKPLKLPDNVGGKTIRCPACRNTFRAPAVAEPPAPEAALAPAPSPAPEALSVIPAGAPATQPAAQSPPVLEEVLPVQAAEGAVRRPRRPL